MNTSTSLAFKSPRLPGSVIAISTTDQSRRLALGIHLLVSILAAGMGMRVGLIYAQPQPDSVGPTQSLESLLAASNRAAGRLLGVEPARRVVDLPPGVDRFAPRVDGLLSENDWDVMLEEARIGRGMLVLVNPDESIPRHLNITIEERILIEECGLKAPIPKRRRGWVLIARGVAYCLMASRVVIPVEPKEEPLFFPISLSELY